MTKISLLLLSLVCIDASAASAPEYFWFKNETHCGNAKITVRSYCEASTPIDGATVRSNSMCTEQQLSIEEPGKKAVRRNLLEHKRPNFLVAWRLTCTRSGDVPYLYVGMANGGNCDSCESDAILDLSGRWVRDGRRWYAGTAVKRDIGRLEKAWYKQDYLHLTNTVVDTKQD